MIKKKKKKSIKEVNDTFRVLALTGPRQVGKTTILKSIIPKNMKIVSLDNETYREEAKENPKFFLETWGKPLFIDEAQYAPELFPYIKIVVDEERNLKVYVTLKVKDNAIIKELSNNLQNKIKSAIKRTSDLDVKEVNVKIKNITTQAIEKNKE